MMLIFATLSVFILALEPIDADKAFVHDLVAFKGVFAIANHICDVFLVKLLVRVCAFIQVRRLSDQQLGHLVDYELLLSV